MTTAEPRSAPQSGTQAVPVGRDRNLSTLSHLSAFVVFVGVPPVVGPLVMWLLHRDDPRVGPHAREALNFNISFLIYSVAAAISILLLVGLLLLPVVAITWFVLTIKAAVKASAGEEYRYPFTLRLVN